MLRLLVKDIIRASAVCKAWYESSVSFRMSDRHPWFMKYSLSSRNIGTCELYDPMQSMTYLTYFPEIIGMMSVHHAKDGWLLMHKVHSSELFFFNPFTRKLINLPSCECYNESAAFTCAPTSEGCLVFGMTNIDRNNYIVGINTLKLGESKWETTHFRSFGRPFTSNTKIIFLKGLFYCLVGLDWVAVFDLSKQQTLNYYCVQYDGSITLSTGTYFVEIKGDIFIIKTGSEKLRFFKLNRDKVWSWEEKERIDEASTIFGASCGSECRSDLPNYLRNKLLLSDAPHPIIKTYFFYEGRKYLTNDSRIPFWGINRNYQCVWIEPPKQSLDFN
ncbi:hypothetical protein N665_0029s0157 [Sinapis alba]|nr:hypothetical protein N665_0029s0157 [Sinapis alba]